ncbi:unnamed protein product [Discula destructiva]
MQLTTLLTTAAILVAPALGQTAIPNATPSLPMSTTATSTPGDVGSLVSQLPTCALSCLESAAQAISCSTSDLPCLCSKADQLIVDIGPCILFSSCSQSDQQRLVDSAQEICANINVAQPSQLAAASSYIASAVGSGTATLANDPASTASGNIARQTDAPVVGLGVMGAAAALAILAL